MDDFLNKSWLFDIYGNLLNENQKKVYEYHILEDLSFNEIADELKKTRQDCHDLYTRADKKLVELDKKLRLKNKFLHIEDYAQKINKLSNDKEIKALSNKIIKLIKTEGNNG